MLEADDAYTGGEHSHGVVALSLAVGDELGLDERDRRDLEFGALLHDIGKIRVPDEIINKPGKLTDEEWEIIKRHPVDGQEMLERIGGVLAEVGMIVRRHHERWDGGGYPDGLAGEAIPLRRAHHLRLRRLQRDDHRPLLPRGDARRRRARRAERCAGAQFDPAVVEALLRGRRAPSTATPAAATLVAERSPQPTAR